MANQYKNEVIYNGQTLISLKDDTITPSKVLSGETFHDRSGAPQTGSMITHNVYDGLDSSSANDALSANMGRLLKSKIPDKMIWANYTNLDLINGTSHGTGCHYTKFGPLCILIIDVQFTSAPTNVHIGTLPAGYRPIVATSVFMQGGESYNADAVAEINTNGIIRVSSVDKYVIGTGIFVIAQ